MWSFDKRPKIRTTAFIYREAAKVFEANYTGGLRSIVREAGFPNVAEVELVAFRFWMTLAAASLAKLPDGTQRGLWLSVFEQSERNHGLGWRQSLEEATVEYLHLTQKDLGRARGAQLLPDTMSFALQRLVSASDETVVYLRMALLQTALGVIKSETQFFRDIQLVS